MTLVAWSSPNARASGLVLNSITKPALTQLQILPDILTQVCEICHGMVSGDDGLRWQSQVIQALQESV